MIYDMKCNTYWLSALFRIFYCQYLRHEYKRILKKANNLRKQRWGDLLKMVHIIKCLTIIELLTIIATILEKKKPTHIKSEKLEINPRFDKFVNCTNETGENLKLSIFLKKKTTKKKKTNEETNKKQCWLLLISQCCVFFKYFSLKLVFGRFIGTCPTRSSIMSRNMVSKVLFHLLAPRGSIDKRAETPHDRWQINW